jgi:hypothetical protein
MAALDRASRPGEDRPARRPVRVVTVPDPEGRRLAGVYAYLWARSQEARPITPEGGEAE